MVVLQNGSQKRNNMLSGIERDTDFSSGPRDPSGFCGLQEEHMSVSQGFAWPVSEKIHTYACWGRTLGLLLLNTLHQQLLSCGLLARVWV